MGRPVAAGFTQTSSEHICSEPVSPLFAGLASVIRTLIRGKDAVWDSSDPLPFFLLPHLQIPSQLVSSLAKGEAAQPWTIVNYCLGQLR